MISIESYVLLIDTDKKAADFHREMTAYCTGMVGECETGRQLSDVFYLELGIEDGQLLADEQNPFNEFIVSRPDEGCWRPSAAYANPKFMETSNGDIEPLTEDNYQDSVRPAYTSVGIFLDEPLSKPLLEIIKERATKFRGIYQPNVQILGFRMLKETRTVEEVTL